MLGLYVPQMANREALIEIGLELRDRERVGPAGMLRGQLLQPERLLFLPKLIKLLLSSEP